MADEKTTKGPFRLKQASAREYLENSEPPDFRFKGSGHGLPRLSERAIAKRRKKEQEMDDEERKRIIREMEERGRKWMAKFVEEDCYTREELIEVTDAIECNIPHNTHRFCKWLAVEHEGEQYWPKFQFDEWGRTPDGFDIVNAVLSHRGFSGYTVYSFWQDVPIDKNPEEKTCFELLQEGKIMYVAKYALYMFMIQGAR